MGCGWCFGCLEEHKGEKTSAVTKEESACSSSKLLSLLTAVVTSGGDDENCVSGKISCSLLLGSDLVGDILRRLHANVRKAAIVSKKPFARRTEMD